MKAIKAPSSVLFPVPVVLVSCGVDRPNLITLAWVGTVCSAPPAVGIGVRPERHSYGLIKETGEFVVNLPRVDQVHLVDYCGQVSGRDTDKWTACGFTPTPGSQVRTPLVAECPVALECRVIHHVPVGAHELFIGQVVAVQADEELWAADGQLDYGRCDPLAYVGGEYWKLGGPVGHYAQWRPANGSR